MALYFSAPGFVGHGIRLPSPALDARGQIPLAHLVTIRSLRNRGLRLRLAGVEQPRRVYGLTISPERY